MRGRLLLACADSIIARSRFFALRVQTGAVKMQSKIKTGCGRARRTARHRTNSTSANYAKAVQVRTKATEQSSNTDTAAQNVQTAKETDLSLYLFELNSLPEETDALTYWLSRECQYANISKLAFDLVSAPSSQAYVERVFSVCGDLSARKHNRATDGLERRVFLKLNKRELAKVQL